DAGLVALEVQVHAGPDAGVAHQPDPLRGRHALPHGHVGAVQVLVQGHGAVVVADAHEPAAGAVVVDGGDPAGPDGVHGHAPLPGHGWGDVVAAVERRRAGDAGVAGPVPGGVAAVRGDRPAGHAAPHMFATVRR